MNMNLMQIAAMGWFSKTLAAIATLRVADALGDHPMQYRELATKTGTAPEALHAALRSLSMLGVFSHRGNGEFANSPLSQRLRDDHPESLRHYVMLAGGLYTNTFDNVAHTIKTGESGFRNSHGTNLYGYLEQNPENADIYDRAMEDLTRPVSMELARTYDFSRTRSVIDLGGGRGALLQGILQTHTHLTGVVGERANVCARAQADQRRLCRSELRDRLSFLETDILTEVPGGFDLYLLKNVLHNWNHDTSMRILRNIRSSMTKTGAHGAGAMPRLLVIEPLIEQESDWLRALFQMTVCQDHTEGRTEDSQTSQLEAAGFTVERVVRLTTRHAVFESVACATSEPEH